MEDRVRHVSGTALSSGRRATSYLQGQGSRQGDITTGGGVATKHSVIGASASDANRKTRLPRFRQSVGSQKLASPRAARRSIYATRTKFDTRESDGSPGLAGTSFEGQSSLDQRAGKPEKTLAFKICFVRRHDEFWSDKISVRSDNESPPEILCLHYDIAERNMFLGLSNGTLMAWTDAFEPATSSDPQASSNGPTVMKAQGHSGAISSLVFLRTLAPDRALRDDCKKPRNDHPPGVPASSSLQAALVCSKTVEREGGFLFTGSADRNIKLWVVEQRKLVCVRTLCFHGGTVVSLAYCFPYLFSASTDGTALVCRAEQTSGSLKYPHFTVVERVFAHSIYHPCKSKKGYVSLRTAWIKTIHYRVPHPHSSSHLKEFHSLPFVRAMATHVGLACLRRTRLRSVFGSFLLVRRTLDFKSASASDPYTSS
ncbi:WD domain, G-beta repeat protein [Toxoplasma gondii TgCatPRC2]|uniref:WD domain, G-beta repeat protein n=4 Tax=Toxoplasma gondii TaxID=5811 RepID=A0A151HDP7_TOXGO|nr:WD domain, G-beta repeat protein [Toxoplasma gondii TgCatPRC2]